ncbi:ABC transporter ATP-binding protein [Photobacterium swingsii]|uniref:ABC transporter ATP-binding protein n=1 Tax=Photobacterium swingsii TaxID=680026 RepID=A0A2T3PAX4_9GAMM|nr:ABC transporter ATP-binding protein [Photobacterium swingsii]PSW26133.1 ABC transporter ATP-binding protein [Photobacterium swingsii]
MLDIVQLRAEISSTMSLDIAYFRAHKGQKVGILGPNGCGKSSLLKAMLGFIPVQNYRYVIDGKDALYMPRQALANYLALVPQHTPELAFSARYFIELACSNPSQQAVDGILQQLGIMHLAESPLNQLSGGERQQVYLARALAQQPQILLLDEPTNHLDVANQVSMLDTIETLPHTCVLVLHDINLAARYCDYVYMMKQGQIVCHGRPNAIMTSENIQTVFGLTMITDRHPMADCPRFTYQF